MAVTGLGCVSPVGLTPRQLWNNLIKGVSGISTIDKNVYPEIVNHNHIHSKIAGQVSDFDLPTLIPQISKVATRKIDLFIQYGLYSSIEALKDANLPIFSDNPSGQVNPKRFGVCLGSAFGGVMSYEKLSQTTSSQSRSSPFSIPSILINMLSSQVAMYLGYQGVNFSSVSACASGSHSIISACQAIELGLADVMVAGGSEAALCQSVMAGFSAIKSLSKNNDSPKEASRPWDKDRNGFVLSNGAASLVIESLEHAQKREAKIYGLISGYGMNADCHHITSPMENGQRAGECMALALESASLKPEQINYINAHGTSTKMGDIAETKAIHNCFGASAQKIQVSSTKSMTGHLLGASGALEALICLLALENQVIPPTINLSNLDGECDLDYVPNEARDAKLNYILSNSFGFGGVNASLIFSKL